MAIRKLFCPFVAIWLVISSGLVAQTQPEIWYGELNARVAVLRLAFHLRAADDGTLQGLMISLDQGDAAIDASLVERSNDQLHMKFDSVAAEFVGKLNDAGDSASGSWTQLGIRYDLTLRKVDAVPQRTHVETWSGLLRAGGREFEMQLRVFEDDRGVRSTVLDSLSEGLQALPVAVKEQGDAYEFDLPVSQAKFAGSRTDDGSKLIGHWKQGGGSFPMEFNRVDLKKTRDLTFNRPQTPQPPFEYRQIDVTVPVADGMFELEGTLTMPRGEGPYPLLILISGSGPQDRDETIFHHKPFWVIADHLTRHGFAVFRYDERGVGESTGNFVEVTTRDLANDVVNIVQTLGQRAEIDARRIALVGHSEGAIIAPMIAVEHPEIAAVVMMAGPGVPGRQIVLNQTRLIAKAAGLSDELLEAQHEMLLRALASPPADGGDRAGLASQAMQAFRERVPSEMIEQLKDVEDQLASAMPMMLAQFESPWFKFFLDYDPAPALSKLRAPVLVINGDLDLQVDPDLNLPVIEAQLKKAGNSDVTIRRFENLNHLFQTCRTGEPREYITIEETIAPSVLECLSQWLTERLMRDNE